MPDARILVFGAAMGDAVVARANQQDLGESPGVVVVGAGHENATDSLSGDTDVSYAEIARAMPTVLRRPTTGLLTGPSAA